MLAAVVGGKKGRKTENCSGHNKMKKVSKHTKSFNVCEMQSDESKIDTAVYVSYFNIKY